jgi:hypothetical protein
MVDRSIAYATRARGRESRFTWLGKRLKAFRCFDSLKRSARNQFRTPRYGDAYAIGTITNAIHAPNSVAGSRFALKTGPCDCVAGLPSSDQYYLEGRATLLLRSCK